jgi:hypothetical protein
MFIANGDMKIIRNDNIFELADIFINEVNISPHIEMYRFFRSSNTNELKIRTWSHLVDMMENDTVCNVGGIYFKRAVDYYGML